MLIMYSCLRFLYLYSVNSTNRSQYQTLVLSALKVVQDKKTESDFALFTEITQQKSRKQRMQRMRGKNMSQGQLFEVTSIRSSRFLSSEQKEVRPSTRAKMENMPN